MHARAAVSQGGRHGCLAHGRGMLHWQADTASAAPTSASLHACFNVLHSVCAWTH